jgi:hypothetical protein
LEKLLVHLKICGSQTNLQQLHDSFDLQDKLFRQCVIVMELFLMNCRASSTGTLVKRLTRSKSKRVPEDRRFTNFDNCTKWPEFFTKDSNSPRRGLSISWRKPFRP